MSNSDSFEPRIKAKLQEDREKYYEVFPDNETTAKKLDALLSERYNTLVSNNSIKKEPFYEVDNKINAQHHDKIVESVKLPESNSDLNIVLQDSLVKGSISLSGNENIKRFIITESLLLGGLLFLEGKVKSKAYFNKTIFQYKVTFDTVEFEDEISFTNAVFLSSVTFKECIFKKNVNFENAAFGANVLFQKCTFEESADFRLSESYINIKGKDYYHLIDCDFTDSTFKKGANFFSRHFVSAIFNRVKFEGIADFHSTKFLSPTCFYRTEFHNTAIFGKAIFKQILVFAYTKVALNFSLHYAQLKGGLNLAYINFVDKGNLELFEMELDSFESSSLKMIGHFDGTKEKRWKQISHREKRETYRLLKHQAILHNNRIHTMENHALEMKAYSKELRSKFPNKLVDLVILYFNRASNNYGLNPALGILFTILMSSVFFIAFWNNLEQPPIVFNSNASWQEAKVVIGEILGYWIQFTNPTHSIEFMKEYSTGWSKFIDVLARVFIGIGIYQTIQAFRKYGRF